MQDDLKQSLPSINGLLWYGLPDGTNLWQPIDGDYAPLL